jgi:hypothetical protein
MLNSEFSFQTKKSPGPGSGSVQNIYGSVSRAKNLRIRIRNTVLMRKMLVSSNPGLFGIFKVGQPSQYQYQYWVPVPLRDGFHYLYKIKFPVH